jgi:hypothetical protein
LSIKNDIRGFIENELINEIDCTLIDIIDDVETELEGMDIPNEILSVINGILMSSFKNKINDVAEKLIDLDLLMSNYIRYDKNRYLKIGPIHKLILKCSILAISLSRNRTGKKKIKKYNKRL